VSDAGALAANEANDSKAAGELRRDPFVRTPFIEASMDDQDRRFVAIRPRSA
jgi:hypothetical protein